MKGCCLCGAVEYEVKKFNGNIYQCHCTLCRKQSGSASNTGALVGMDNFEWLKGNESIVAWRKDTGFSSSFCKHCGSPVPNQLRSYNYYWLPVGCLEGSEFRVVANICLETKAPWATVSADGDRVQGMPDVEEFLLKLSQSVGE